MAKNKINLVQKTAKRVVSNKLCNSEKYFNLVQEMEQMFKDYFTLKMYPILSIDK